MWHNRLLLYLFSKNKRCWVRATPDSEEDGIFEEAFLESKPDDWFITAYGLGCFDSAPQPSKHPVYDFDPAPSLDDSKGWMKRAIKLARQKLDAKKQKLDVESKSFIYEGKLYDIQSFEELRSSPVGRRVRGKRKFEPGTPGSCGLNTQPRRLRSGRDTSEGVLPGDASTDIGG